MDTETEDYEEVDEEEIVAETAPRQVKKVISKKPITQKKTQPVQEEKLPESRYVAYRVQAEEGIMDTETNIPVGNEVYVILAEILNKLNNIEISQA